MPAERFKPVFSPRPWRFRIALRRATYRAWRDRKITPEQAYLIYDVLDGSKKGGRYYTKPQLLTEAEKAIRKELVVYDSVAAETGDVDWANWIDLLVDWLPIVIKVFLTILAFVEPPPSEPSDSNKIRLPGKPNG